MEGRSIDVPVIEAPSPMPGSGDQTPMPDTPGGMEPPYSPDASTIAPMGGGTRPIAAGEREIEAAEFEMRIRKFTLELIQPTIRKTTLLDHTAKELARQVKEVDDRIKDLSTIAMKTEQTVETVDTFRVEMQRWDNDRRENQVKAQEGLSTMRQDLDMFRYQLERQDSSIHSVQRTTDRVVGELARVQEGNEALRMHVERRVRETTSLLNSSKADLEAKIVDLEARHNRLSDELWDESTGLAKIQREILKTNEELKSVGDEIRSMRHDKASTQQLHAVQHEVNGLLQEANGNIEMLRKSVETSLNDVKAHFNTATNTVAAHSAAMLQEVRVSYQDELNQSAKMRSEILVFMKEARENIARMEEVLAKSTDQTEETLKKVSGEVEEVGRARRRDRSNNEVEVLNMREMLSSVHGTSDSVAKSLEHLSSIVWMVVQSERAASALDIQDDTDRGKVALMGYRDGPGRGGAGGAGPGVKSRGKAAASSPMDDRGSPSPGPGAGGPVISVDHRCLSCSGQAQAVLSGFKMACLEYAPGPVSFAKKVYERSDLLDLRDKLLDQAHQALQQGPISFNKTDAFGGKEQQTFHHSSKPDRRPSRGAIAQNSPGTGPVEAPPLIDDRPASRASTGSGSQTAVKMPPLSARGAVTAR